MCRAIGAAGAHLIGWTLGLTDVIVFLSLALLVRTSGQISLSQVTFVAIGAAALSHFSAGLGLPWLAALLLAGVIAMPVGRFWPFPPSGSQACSWRLPPSASGSSSSTCSTPRATCSG